MDTVGIIIHLDQSAHVPSSKDLVGLQPESSFTFLKDLLHRADKLHSELLLSDVIVGLDHHLDSPPCT